MDKIYAKGPVEGWRLGKFRLATFMIRHAVESTKYDTPFACFTCGEKFIPADEVWALEGYNKDGAEAIVYTHYDCRHPDDCRNAEEVPAP